jgi:DNA-dependent RNA polymerase auxiliary subunit epsilon
MQLKRNLIALATATLLANGLVHAADTATTTAPADRPMAATPDATRDRNASMNEERQQLQQKLSTAGQNRADYARILQENGYRIAAINADRKDYLEYEVVKDKHSFEVQIDFKDGAARATKVDVAPNLWRADATKRMEQDANYKHPSALVADPQGRYSDRRYMKAWNDEKDRLEKALPPNLKVTDYRPKIESMGYKVTSVNESEKNHVEYEIAKGDNSYEVKIDVDPQTRVAKDVDVTSNLWEAESTDRATDAAKAHKN